MVPVLRFFFLLLTVFNGLFLNPKVLLRCDGDLNFVISVWLCKRFSLNFPWNWELRCFYYTDPVTGGCRSRKFPGIFLDFPAVYTTLPVVLQFRFPLRAQDDTLVNRNGGNNGGISPKNNYRCNTGQSTTFFVKFEFNWNSAQMSSWWIKCNFSYNAFTGTLRDLRK